MARNYQDLIAWQKAMDLVEEVYRASAAFPSDERYGLIDQIRRASISIPSNIAEGQGRFSRREFGRFLSIAHGSVREVETQLLIAKRLGFLSSERCQAVLTLAGEVGRLITGLVRSIDRES